MLSIEMGTDCFSCGQFFWAHLESVQVDSRFRAPETGAVEKSPAPNQVPEPPADRLQGPRLLTLASLLTLVVLSLFGCGETGSQPVAQMDEARLQAAEDTAPSAPKPQDPLRTGPIEYTKIGIIAMDAKPWALEHNYERLERYVREAAQRDAQVVVAPEAILDGYVCYAAPNTNRERMLEVAQTVPNGRYIVRARKLSRELGIYLVFGFLERVGEKMFNSLVMIDPEGEILAKYSKVHVGGESYITPGRELKPFDTPLGRLGFLICMDRTVPENIRTLGVQGAEIVFLPMDGGGGPSNTQRMARYAADNGCWIVVANTWSSAILSPRGDVRLERYETERVTIGRVTDWEVPKGTGRRNMIARRPDLYRPLIESLEPVRWYDAKGYPTSWAEEERARHREEIKTSE